MGVNSRKPCSHNSQTEALKKEMIETWLLNCDPQTSSMGLAWAPVRRAVSQVTFQAD